MKYWKNITIELEDIDLLEATDKLMSLNILSVTIKDKQSPNNSNWFENYKESISFNCITHKVSLLINDKDSTEKLVKSVKDILNLKYIPKYIEEKFQDQNWEIYTQEKFNEIIISDNLRIIPPWNSKDNFKGITIIIEPGSGFGVGNHPTTQLCLRWLESNLIRGDSFLDYGSGSGILSIAAKKLGARQSAGIEIEHRALNNSITNSILNKTEIKFYNSKKQLCKKKFDIVSANILYDVLIQISPELQSLTKKNLILTGILNNQVDKIIYHFSDWIKLVTYEEKENWYLLHGIL